jgi:hypothetical protein
MLFPNNCDYRVYTIGVLPLFAFYLHLFNSVGKSRFSTLSARIPTKYLWRPSLLFALKHGAITKSYCHTLGFTWQTTSLIRLYILGFRCSYHINKRYKLQQIHSFSFFLRGISKVNSGMGKYSVSPSLVLVLLYVLASSLVQAQILFQVYIYTEVLVQLFNYLYIINTYIS